MKRQQVKGSFPGGGHGMREQVNHRLVPNSNEMDYRLRSLVHWPAWPGIWETLLPISHLTEQLYIGDHQ
jgi:hypothetical protein